MHEAGHDGLATTTTSDHARLPANALAQYAQEYSVRAGGGPDVDVSVGRVTVDLGQLAGGEVEVPERGDVLVELGHAAGAAIVSSSGVSGSKRWE